MSCCKSAYGDHEVRGCHRKNEDRTAWRGEVEADDIEAGHLNSVPMMKSLVLMPGSISAT